MNRISKDEYYLGIALSVSKRSTCLKRHYGCVIVKNDEIIATGYNGSPRGKDNCCDIYNECPRKDIAHNSGDYSNCSSVHAEQNAIISASRKDMMGATLYLAGEELTLLNDSGEHIHCKNWEEVVDCIPCPVCKRMIANSGILRIVNRNGEVKWD